ncbi:hypothetical protein ES703_48882 [subsurface metagenome]
MDFNKALEISVKFQRAYDTLLRINGQKLEERAKPYIGLIENVINREKCTSVEAVLIILKNWHNGSQTVPSSALTLWLLASAVILEDRERVQLPLLEVR